MNPGKLAKRLTFQIKDDDARGPDGDRIEGYKDSFTVWGSFTFLKGRKYFEAAAANSEIQGETEIRYRADVNADMKIKYKNVIYDIISAIPTEKHTLSIMWKRGGMNG
ncbi:phage head-tail joining family protein [Bacillus cereus ATCC 4342]|uniref:phage head closure protein n=1 Tax=Bacillus tropicus TaxID=2026188 RepID=UPI0002D53446|nr:phage head closure protein [Bacillus tropicus]AJH76421.1 phage head-tail joining family protein [Bacillus cereus ATCC 4342]KFM85227.1 phage head-tail joining family protein [Bacillus cereus ATCC 4342]MDR4454330.1 head-tail adaptor protein [Bacillus tropicus]QKH57512.1 phage head closure protein [Bacillus tropicus]